MDTLATSIPVVLFAVFLWIISAAFRKVSEIVRPALAKGTPPSTFRNIWEKVVLQNIAVVFGATFVFLLPAEDYPSITMTNNFSKVLFGVFTGAFCSYFYASAKGALQASLGKLSVKNETPEASHTENEPKSTVIVPPPIPITEDVPPVATEKSIEPPVKPPPAA